MQKWVFFGKLYKQNKNFKMEKFQNFHISKENVKNRI